MEKKYFNVLKSSGVKERFSPTKLHKSLKRTGLAHSVCQNITKKVSREIKSGSSTKEIYRKALQLVNLESRVAAVHYSLKKAILDLGPTGYEFEKFVAKYFHELGYKTKTGVTLRGQFVKHEVDVIASASDKDIMVECKFHNHPAKKNDIKTVLYVKARWDDIKNGPDGKNLEYFYLATNTSFSEDAIKYAQGTGLKLLGVNAPAEESFLEKIKHHKLYPITCLKRLKRYIRNQLLNKKILLCKELLQEKDLLIRLGLSINEIESLFTDIRQLMEENP